MTAIGDNIDALIENIKVSEQYAESQRNELQIVESEIARVTSEMFSMSLEKEELQSALKKLLNNVNKQEATVMSLENEVKILRVVHNDLRELYEKENKTLSEKQRQVWKSREFFYNKLRHFSEDWGPLSTSWSRLIEITPSKKDVHPFHKSEAVSLAQQNQDHQLEENVKNLKLSIAAAKEQLADAEENLKNVKSIKIKLSEEPDCGEEFVSLQKLLRQAQMETEILEKQCEEAKQECWHKKTNPKNVCQLAFLPEPLLKELSSSNTSSQPLVFRNPPYSGEIKGEKTQPVHLDKISTWRRDFGGSNTTQQVGMKRPVAAIAPAMENYYPTTNDETINMASSPKKVCSFIPKKPSSLSKKYFTHSKSWMQLEEELSVLLKKDLHKPL